MRSCPSPGLSAVSSTGDVFADALPFATDAFASPFAHFSDAWDSSRIACEGVRCSGIVCFCRAIGTDSSSMEGHGTKQIEPAKPQKQ